MAELDDLSITDASNTARFPENMQFRNVNDSARALEGMLAREFKDRNMSLTATGSANAFAVSPNRTIASLTDSLVIGFTANHSITGPATLNVGGLGAKPIVSSNGSALIAGDIVSGQKLQVIYRTASQDWQIHGQRTAGSNADTTARVIKVGTVFPWPSDTLPAGYLWANGAAVSRTTYAELFSVYGTTYGSGDGSSTFNLPNYKGRSVFGKDTMGGTSAAGLLSSTYGLDGATLGATGGAESVTLTQSQMPQHSHANTLTDPGHTHTMNGLSVTQGSGAVAVPAGNGTGGYATGSASTGITISNANAGGGQAHSNMPPGIVQNWIILALPAAASAATLGVNGHLYKWSTGTSDTDPGSGKLGFDNSTLSSATTLFVSETDAAGGPMSNVLALWDDSTSAVKGTLYIYKVGQLSTYCVFALSGTRTDATNYSKFSVTHAASNGTFAADDQLAVIFTAKGDQGDPGAGLEWQGPWLTATAYAIADGVKNGGSSYICTVAHTSGASTEPGVGASWATVWDVIAEKGAAGSGSGDMVAANNLSDVANAATAFANIKQAASETATGVVELATTAEATTGTDTARAVTPAGLKAHVDARNGTTASSAITDNRVVRGDGGARGLQESPVGIDDSGNVSGIGYIELAEIAAPSTPSSGLLRVYAKSDGKLYQKNDAGTETDLSQSGGGSSAAAIIPQNVGLAVSASAGALTIALKGADGNDPSGSNIVYLPFRSATGTTGTETTYQVTSATSLTISSGSTLGVTSSTAFRIWVVAFDDAGTIRLGAVNCVTISSSRPTAVFGLIDDSLGSSTAEGGAGAADSSGVIYTGTAVTSKAYRILGYVEWGTSGVTAGTWTTTNLATVQVWSPGLPAPGMPTGNRAAVVKTDTFTSTIASAYTDITGFNVSITPRSAANMVRVIGFWNNIAGGSNIAATQLVRGSTAINVGDSWSGIQATSTIFRTTDAVSANFNGCDYLDNPASTSSTTYKVQFYLQADTYYFNRTITSSSSPQPRMASTIAVEEIMG